MVFNEKIDAEQARIQQEILQDEENPLEEPEQYANTFINKVDAFQAQMREQVPDPETRDLLGKTVYEVLEAAKDDLNIDGLKLLKESLDDGLAKYKVSMAALAELRERNHEVTEGECKGGLSAIVANKFGLSNWKEDPARVFSAVRILQEQRESTGSFPKITAEGELVLEAKGTDVDHLDAGELLDLQSLDLVKSGRAEDIQWYMDCSPKYARGLQSILDARKAVESAETTDEPDYVEAILGMSPTEGVDLGKPMSPEEAEAILSEQGEYAIQMSELMYVEGLMNQMRDETEGRPDYTGMEPGEKKLPPRYGGLAHKVAEMRRESSEDTWLGVMNSDAWKPSNLAAGWAGSASLAAEKIGIIDEATTYETREMTEAGMAEEYLSDRRAATRGSTTLYKLMDRQKMSMKEAWQQLITQKPADQDFMAFVGSPEGNYLRMSYIDSDNPMETVNEEERQAQMIFEKAEQIKGAIGPEHAEEYYAAVIAMYPDTSWAKKSELARMTTGEIVGDVAWDLYDNVARLDMLALMVATHGAGQFVAETQTGTRIGIAALEIAERSPKIARAAKLIPGMRAFAPAADASLGLRVGAGVGNFGWEMLKFTVYSKAAYDVGFQMGGEEGGEAAAHAMSVLFFLVPGYMHGFEKQAGKAFEVQLREQGPAAMEKLGADLVEKTGSPERLRSLLKYGVEQEAKRSKTVMTPEQVDAEVERVMAQLKVGQTAASTSSLPSEALSNQARLRAYFDVKTIRAQQGEEASLTLGKEMVEKLGGPREVQLQIRQGLLKEAEKNGTTLTGEALETETATLMRRLGLEPVSLDFAPVTKVAKTDVINRLDAEGAEALTRTVAHLNRLGYTPETIEKVLLDFLEQQAKAEGKTIPKDQLRAYVGQAMKSEGLVTRPALPGEAPALSAALEAPVNVLEQPFKGTSMTIEGVQFNWTKLTTVVDGQAYICNGFSKDKLILTAVDSTGRPLRGASAKKLEYKSVQAMKEAGALENSNLNNTQRLALGLEATLDAVTTALEGKEIPTTARLDAISRYSKWDCDYYLSKYPKIIEGLRGNPVEFLEKNPEALTTDHNGTFRKLYLTAENDAERQLIASKAADNIEYQQGVIERRLAEIVKTETPVPANPPASSPGTERIPKATQDAFPFLYKEGKGGSIDGLKNPPRAGDVGLDPEAGAAAA